MTWLDYFALTEASLLTGWDPAADFRCALSRLVPQTYRWPAVSWWQWIVSEDRP